MADEYPLCRAILGKDGNVEFESANAKGLTLSQTIENDRHYGIMFTAKGRHFTYAVLNEDEEFTDKQIHRAVRYAFGRWRLYANLPKLKRVPKDYKDPIDFRIEFRTTESDPDKQLTNNTIMYHYYPIHNVQNPLRGLCVVNKRFFFTSHGNKISGQEMMRKGRKVSNPDGTYSTIDFDVVYCHELGHGLGLPHDTEPHSIMSTPYHVIAEMPSDRDQKRISAPHKYGKRMMARHRLVRWVRWLRVASDR